MNSCFRYLVIEKTTFSAFINGLTCSQRLLELVSVLIMNLPLIRVCEPDLSTSLVVGSPTAAAAAYHKRIGMPSVDAIPFYEDVSVALFHSIMTVASSDVCEPTTTDGEAQVHSLPLTIF